MLDKCEGCGGKYQPPGSPLHVDYACDCKERAERKVDRIVQEIERADWEEVEGRRNRRTFKVGRIG